MGSDVFSRKCGAHNIIVPRHSSCPVCVSAKRSQLHAANLAHMPRYLFEQQLDVKSTPQGTPVRTYMKNPCVEVVLSASKSKLDVCEKRYTVNYPSNNFPDYTKLHSTVQAFLMALDRTDDARVHGLRTNYQRMIDDPLVGLSEKGRHRHNLAIDMWYEIIRIKDCNTREFDFARKGFMEAFIKLYERGQRLVDADNAEGQPSTDAAPSAKRWTLNNIVTLTVIPQLPTYNLDVDRIMQFIDTCPPRTAELRMRLQNNMPYEPPIVRLEEMARAVCATAISEYRGAYPNSLLLYVVSDMRTIEQCLVTLYKAGQRVRYVTETAPPAVTAPKYRINFSSINAASTLNQTTQNLLRKLDKYEGSLGELRFQHEQAIASVTDDANRQHYVMNMSAALWGRLSMADETRSLTKIRDQFLATVEHCYFEGQRLIPNTGKTPPEVIGIDGLTGCLYQYLTTSSQELYHEQVALEELLDNARAVIDTTRDELVLRFRDLADMTMNAYYKDKMPSYSRLNQSNKLELQRYLANQYLSGVRR